MAQIKKDNKEPPIEQFFTPEYAEDEVSRVGRPSNVFTKLRPPVEMLSEKVESTLKKAEELPDVVKNRNRSARLIPKPKSKKFHELRYLEEWMRELNDEDWTHLSCYLYRLYPKIIRQQSDKASKNYIDIYGSHFTTEDILSVHGSGRYQLIFLDSNDVKEALCKANLELEDVEKPAIYVLEELDITHPSNKGVVDRLKSEGKIGLDNKLTGQGMISAQQVNQGDPQMMGLVMKLLDKMDSKERQAFKSAAETNSETAMAGVMKVMQDANKTAMDIVSQNIKSDNPDKMLEMFKMMTTLMNREPAKPEISTMDVLKIIQESNAKTNEMMLAMLNRKQEDPLEAMIKTKELLDALKDDGGSTKGGGWKEQLVEVGLPLLGNIAMAIAGAVAAKNAAMGTPQASSQASVAQTPQGLPQASQTVSQAQQPQPQINPLDQYGAFLVGAIARGDSGDLFADSINVMLGPESGIVAQIQGQGAIAVLSSLKSHPPLWKALERFGEPKVKTFIEEFMSYKREGGPEVEDSEESEVEESE